MFRRKLFLAASLLAGLLFGIQLVLAQTATTTTGTTCPDGTTVPSGTACPTVSPETTCASGGGKWCKNSDLVSGWCSYSTSPCPAYDSASCAAQSGEWCTYTSGTGSWCATPPSTCPVNDEATCVAKGRNWCKSQSGGSGWCTMNATEKCPAYDEPSCKALGGEWCAPSCSTCTGWCAVGQYASCPINDEATCVAKGRQWCKPTQGGIVGWCSSTGMNCPANDEPSCTAQGGRWCTTSGSPWCDIEPYDCPTSGGTTPTDTEASCKTQGGVWCTTQGTPWCDTPPIVCPTSGTTTTPPGTITDEPGCKAQGGRWCTKALPGTSYGATAPWCDFEPYDCPSDGTTPPPPPPPTLAWPSTESDCKLYKGKWCPASGGFSTSATSGFCQEADETCPISAPPGKFVCWDNKIVDTFSQCSSMPTTKDACTKPGKNWCLSYAATQSGGTDTSGWCSADPCAKWPPPGKIKCPDGATFAVDISGCPKIGSEPPPPPDDMIICPNGTKVPRGSTCPVEDSVTVCLNKKGVWCPDTVGNGKGYCSLTGSCIKKPAPPPEKEVLTERQVKQAERERKQLLTKLASLERFFKRVNSVDALAKTGVLKTKIEGFPLDTVIFDNLQAAEAEIEVLRELKSELEEEGTIRERPELDERAQKKALQQIRRSVGRFDAAVKLVARRVARLEKDGFKAPAQLTEELERAQGFIKTARTSDNYEEARDALEAAQDSISIINNLLPQVEQLFRLKRLLPAVKKEIVRREQQMKRLEQLAKRLEVALDDRFIQLNDKLSAIKVSFDQAVSGEIGDQEAFDFLRDNIFAPLDDLDNELEVLGHLTNSARAVRIIQAKLNSYEAQIKRLAARKRDVSEARTVLAEAKEQLATLRTVLKGALTDENLDTVSELLASLAAQSDQLEDLLRLRKPTVLDQELKRKLTPEEKLSPVKLPELEKVSVNAHRLATFFRRTPTDLIGLLRTAPTRGNFDFLVRRLVTSEY